MRKMKNFLMAVLVLTLATVLCGCMVVRFPSQIDQESDPYRSGAERFSEPIDAIEVEWVAGSVRFVYADTSEISIEETANRTLAPTDQMQYDLNKGTLHVHFSPQANREWLNLEKELTVTLPHGTELDRVQISSASAEITLEDLLVWETEIESVSGSAYMTLNGARKITAKTVSGDMDLHCEGEMQEIEMYTTSGEVRAELEMTEEGKAEAVSGSIYVRADAIGKSEFSTTSGDIQVELNSAPVDCEMDSISGDVRLELPENVGFTASISSISGNISNGFASSSNGKTFLCGDGTARIEINTVSGNILLAKRLEDKME